MLPGHIGIVLGVFFTLLGYCTPYISASFSRKDQRDDARRALVMDRVGSWIEFGGFLLTTLGLLNLMDVLPPRFAP